MACILPNSYHRPVPLLLAEVNIDIQFPTHFLGDDGQRAGFLLLTGFLASWLFIRTSARMIRAQVSWWPGNVETSGGLHIHHLVWGILLLMVSGFLGFALQPPNLWMDVLAVLFGIGMGLTLDEFALWLHLEDVYWSDEGRQSVDAVVVAFVFGGLVVLGAAPWEVDGASGSVAAIAFAVAFHIGYCSICALKGKVWMTVFGLLIPFIGLTGAIRLAKPGSPWARRFYKDDGRRLEKAKARWSRLEARRHRALNALAGEPSKPDPET
jgi:lysyl-tRNA synthetase, class II